ncbi:M20 aminoacylase family protein [Pinirhizobacter soli]|uniref:M20 aminoacylase family protein n=1 Tax=Pinirhizobacter soli TaxID=2786953 RepID=UPI00202AA2BA|nr:M20 aminoacylase family protein [Pinirhizobacter soli]
MTTDPTSSLHDQMIAWRRELHAHPEFGFELKHTAEFVAAKLREFGITDIEKGVGGTGIVATLQRGDGSGCVALRADMDALKIRECTSHAYGSRHDGLMHACGHDGHTAMLLGAARTLAMEGGFSGTVRFIFQPAEEWGRGALAMLDDGLMQRFPFDEIYGLHNWPGMPAGHFGTRAGALMGAEDNFEIRLDGRGGHASRPHAGREVMVAACSAVMNLQSIVSRRTNPTDVAVVSVTELLTDGTRNALPGKARILGDVRSFDPEVSALVEYEMRQLANGTAAAYGCAVDVSYTREFIPVINDETATATAVAAARKVFGIDKVNDAMAPVTVSEDFAQFQWHVPGCFGLIGNGADSLPLHNATYDFNDEILPLGAAFFTTVVRDRLAERIP